MHLPCKVVAFGSENWVLLNFENVRNRLVDFLVNIYRLFYNLFDHDWIFHDHINRHVDHLLDWHLNNFFDWDDNFFFHNAFDVLWFFDYVLLQNRPLNNFFDWNLDDFVDILNFFNDVVFINLLLNYLVNVFLNYLFSRPFDYSFNGYLHNFLDKVYLLNRNLLFVKDLLFDNFWDFLLDQPFLVNRIFFE